MNKKFIFTMVFIFVFSFVSISSSQTYNFVRIENLAEQVIGEKLLFEIYKKVGIEITITPMPGKRAIIEASKGNKDGETLRIFDVGEKFPTLKRVSTPISELQTVAFVKDNNIILNSLEDLGKFSIVITRGVAHTEKATEKISSVHIVDNNEGLMQIVSVGRKQIALTSLFDGQVILKKLKIDTVHPSNNPPLKIYPLYHYIHEKNIDIIDKVEKIVKEMVESGEMKKMKEKFEKEYIDSI